MKENENIKKGVLLISTLSNALAGIECKTREEIQEDLRKEEIDLDSSMARFKIFFRMRSINAEEKPKSFATDTGKDFKTEGKSIMEKIAGWSKDKIIDRLNELSAEPDAVYGASSYRNLEDISIEDLSSLLEDLETAIQKRKMGKQ